MSSSYVFRSSIDSEPALVLGPLKSLQELRQEQQLAEIEARRQERERKGQEEEGTKPPVQEMVDELRGPFAYEFSYWARYYNIFGTVVQRNSHGAIVYRCLMSSPLWGTAIWRE